MHDAVEHMKVFVACLKHRSVFRQNFFCDLCAPTSAWCIFAVAELDDHFVVRFFTLTRRNVRVIIFDFSAGLFLFCIILRNCIIEQFCICFPHILLLEQNVLRDLIAVNILRNEVAVVVFEVCAVGIACLAECDADAESLHSSSFLFPCVRFVKRRLFCS